MNSRRILMTTIGSLGDLHPFLAVGQELQRRGHVVTVASMRFFCKRIQAAGLDFAPLRATSVDEPTPEFMRRALNGRRATEFLVREVILPPLRTAYQDTLAAAEGTDLLVGHPLTFATRLVAETRGLPWISTQLAPAGFLSPYDPPDLPGLGWLRRLGAGPRVFGPLLRLGDRRVRGWLRPYDALRTELELPDWGNPLFAGAHSPFGVLALFSSLLGARQPDWPAHTTVTGFPFFDQPAELTPEVESWLAAGPAPVVFTLGSSAAMGAGNFFEESAGAAKLLGVRALLLGVNLTAEAARLIGPQSAASVSEEVLRLPYAPYARLFSRAAAVVHPAGIGTTAEVMRAGRPMLAVPFANDQPDNASRAVRLGTGRILLRSRYRAPLVASALREVLGEGCTGRAAAIGRLVQAEDGAATAADAVENVLRGAPAM